MRVADFVGVVDVDVDKWAAMSTLPELVVHQNDSAPLIGHALVIDGGQRLVRRRESLLGPGRRARIAALAGAAGVLRVTYSRPIQQYGLIGPSRPTADVQLDGAAWTALQVSYCFLRVFAVPVDLPCEKLRVIYLDGASCYDMNGPHDNDAVLQIAERPLRRQGRRRANAAASWPSATRAAAQKRPKSRFAPRRCAASSPE